MIEKPRVSYADYYNHSKMLRQAASIHPVYIKQVIFNPPATIVLWSDGTKTVVKAGNEPFDKEKGLAMAICKRTCGNKGNYFNVFRKYCHDDEEPVTEVPEIVMDAEIYEAPSVSKNDVMDRTTDD